MQHSEHEWEYTPDVFDSFKVLEWDAETDALGDELGEYKDVKMSSMSICVLFPYFMGYDFKFFNSTPFTLITRSSLIRKPVYEMSHKLPFPLLPRVFPVLIITSRTGRSGFIVVQIPINLKALPESFYSSGRNQTQGDTAVKRKRPVLG